jgi:hypothetical protein
VFVAKLRLHVRELTLHTSQGLLQVAAGSLVRDPFMVPAAAEDVRGRRPVMLTRLAVDALPCVAAMVDALVSACPFQCAVGVLSPLRSRPLDPLAPMERPTLRRAAAFWTLAVCPSEPLHPRTRDAVVLALRKHHMHVRVVFLSSGIPAAVNRERVRQLLL